MGGFRRWCGVLILVGLSACAGSSSPTSSTIRPGEWGNLGIEMMVNASGAQITFCCSTGVIPPPLTLDGGGNFELQGTVTLTGGPVPVDGFKPAQAVFTGTVNGNTMNLTVRAQGFNNSYVLIFGKQNTALCVCPL